LKDPGLGETLVLRGENWPRQARGESERAEKISRRSPGLKKFRPGGEGKLKPLGASRFLGQVQYMVNTLAGDLGSGLERLAK
jgi:hypothetical protein